jgi:WD and tetratricopeptide repeat-containing protein 1
MDDPSLMTVNISCSQGQYIVAGSDDGSFFIWDRHTTNIMRVLRGDDSIVNCLQPHPSYCLLATSGIDPVVRLWSPRPEVMTKYVRHLMRVAELTVPARRLFIQQKRKTCKKGPHCMYNTEP